MIKIKVPTLLIVLFLTFTNFCYAELNEAEEQVIFYMNYLQEMSYTAEYTEGMPKKDVEYLDMTIEEGIKFFVSASIISPRNLAAKNDTEANRIADNENENLMKASPNNEPE